MNLFCTVSFLYFTTFLIEVLLLIYNTFCYVFQEKIHSACRPFCNGYLGLVIFRKKMDGQYPINKYVYFINNWINKIKEEKDISNFYDDAHIDEIDSYKISRSNWINGSWIIFKEMKKILIEKYPDINILLCIELNAYINNDIISIDLNLQNNAQMYTPPSIYIFNKKNSDIEETLNECIKTKCIINNEKINAFAKLDESSSLIEIIFITDSDGTV